MEDFRASSVVGIALAAHLDVCRQTPGGTGRQLLQQVMELSSSSRVTDILKGKEPPERQLEMAYIAEREGLIPHGEVTGLASQLRLAASARPTVGASWWPRLRDVNGLAKTDGSGLRSAVDVLICAEAFCDYYKAALNHPRNRSRSTLSGSDSDAFDSLVRKLCDLAIGPYGVDSEAVRLLTRMVVLAPEVIAEEIGSHPVATQLIRVLESSVRHLPPNHSMWQTFSKTLDRPPEILVDKHFWLRGLRRHALVARKRRGDQPHSWAIEQLRLAMVGERAYVDSTPSERRYALWCLAELVQDEQTWASMTSEVMDHRDLAGLLPVCVEFRERVPQGGASGFAFTPAKGWPMPAAAKDALDLQSLDTKKWKHRELWKPIRPGTSRRLVNFLMDALCAPSAVRQQAAVDLLVCSGERVRAAATDTLGLVEPSQLDDGSHSGAFLERLHVVRGLLGERASIKALEGVLGEPSASAVEVEACLNAARHLVVRHPSSSAGLVGWVRDVVDRSPTRHRCVAGVRAYAAHGHKAEALVEAIPLADDHQVGLCQSWALKVIRDPLRRFDGDDRGAPSAPVGGLVDLTTSSTVVVD